MRLGYSKFLLVFVFFAYGIAKEDIMEEDQDVEVTKPIILTDETFEHLTQASTGATTGDWFVKFYAPWCGHCRRLEPTWNELAEKVGGKVNIAKINVDESPSTAERFNIKGFPTLIFLRRGKFYKYTSSDRTLETLERFTSETYKEAEEQGEVPRELTTLDYAVKVFWKFYDEMIFGFNSIFHMFELGHLPWYAKFWISVFILFSPALLLAVCIFW